MIQDVFNPAFQQKIRSEIIPMRPIFHNPAYNTQFEQDHYFVTPFLDASEVQQLRDIYYELAEDLGGKFHLSLWTTDIENRKLVHGKIMEVFKPRAAELLDNFKFIISSYTYCSLRRSQEFLCTSEQ